MKSAPADFIAIQPERPAVKGGPAGPTGASPEAAPLAAAERRLWSGHPEASVPL
jgi:hypothetical protein